jgi:hypothetical protein
LFSVLYKGRHVKAWRLFCAIHPAEQVPLAFVNYIYPLQKQVSQIQQQTMAQQQLSEMTVEELKAREKGLGISTKVMAIAVVIMLACGIYITVSKKEFSIFTVLPLVFLANLFIYRALIKKVKAELARRNGV